MICISWEDGTISWERCMAYHETKVPYHEKTVLYHENSVLHIMRPWYHIMIRWHYISWEQCTTHHEKMVLYHENSVLYISWDHGTISWEQCTTYHETKVPHHDKMVLYDENRDRFIIAWQGKLASGKCPLRDPISTRLLGTFASGCGSCVSVRAWARTGGHWLCPCLCVCQANGCQSEHEKKVVGESLLYDCLVSPYCSGSYFSSV